MKTRALLMVGLLALSAHADDWPRFRGPNFDNTSKEKGLLKEWKAPPKLLWTYKDAGNGYSGPAIVGDTLYTMGARNGDEYLFALDLTKSPPVQKWAEKIGPTFTGGLPFNKGPNATPTVADGQVYALGGGGDLLCTTTGGAVVWRKSMVKDLKGEINTIANKEGTLAWGYAGSPLVDGDQLICVPGGAEGTVAALEVKTGKTIWQTKKDLTESATYTSPVLATIGGTKQYVVMLQDGVAGIDTKGALLWRCKRDNAFDEIQASTPVVKDNLVFMSGVKGGTELIEVTAAAGAFAPKQVAKDRRLESWVGGTTIIDDVIFGCSGYGRSDWFAFNLKTKKAEKKADREIPNGSLTSADGKLYLLSEEGKVGLANASIKDWKIISQFTLPEKSKIRPTNGRIWTIPVIADGKLYLRDQELIFCYEVK